MHEARSSNLHGEPCACELSHSPTHHTAPLNGMKGAVFAMALSAITHSSMALMGSRVVGRAVGAGRASVPNWLHQVGSPAHTHTHTQTTRWVHQLSVEDLGRIVNGEDVAGSDDDVLSLDDVQLVDVREPNELMNANIPKPGVEASECPFLNLPLSESSVRATCALRAHGRMPVLHAVMR